MNSFSGLFKKEHAGELVLAILLIIYLIMGRKTPVPLAVIVNSDGFLLRKKGKAFMPENERMEIIAGIVGVDYVIPWDDGSQTVTGALSILQPLIFTKGGDRDAATNVPEFDLCEKIGTRVMFNVGGGKIQSSSALISAAKES